MSEWNYKSEFAALKIGNKQKWNTTTCNEAKRETQRKEDIDRYDK